MGMYGFEHKRTKTFANGCVHALLTRDGYPIEVTDTFLPFYTKDAIGRNQNGLTQTDLGSRMERWMIGVSCMSGCPVGCKFCATGQLKRWRPLSANEIFHQVMAVIMNRFDYDPECAQEFKINYTRMGEPFMNITAVREAINMVNEAVSHGTHHYVSTIGVKGSDFSWIDGNITLQISLHSLDEERRQQLIPHKKLMSLEELGQIRTGSNQKTTLNLTLVDEADFDINKLTRYFDPEHFFIKLSPINENEVSRANELGSGIIQQQNLL